MVRIGVSSAGPLAGKNLLHQTIHKVVAEGDFVLGELPHSNGLF